MFLAANFPSLQPEGICYNYLFFKCAYFKTVFGTVLTMIDVHV